LYIRTLITYTIAISDSTTQLSFAGRMKADRKPCSGFLLRQRRENRVFETKKFVERPNLERTAARSVPRAPLRIELAHDPNSRGRRRYTLRSVRMWVRARRAHLRDFPSA